MGWDSNSRDKQSRGNKSFLFSFFSLDPNFKEPLKMPVYQNKENEIYCHSYFGLGFGNDLELGYDNLNMNEYCSSYLDYTYKAPFGYEYDLKQARNFLAGSCDN
ncbi:hypothetical protein M0813_03413 [Anaeramoeba flamelloides]|uniref:Uncharacterized protein n=1 Tax=Anaeramoeba flamelloides TaxID=1746091 RepID=A0ABQ8XWL3_9EUKA|nr:hypothetical protein M0813_03413 [Anaeramoeba flamelloides]